jgi:hypothetical protein
MVEINAIASDGTKKNDLSVGEYDVVIETGPSYATRRQEAAKSMETVLKSYPQLMSIMGDLFFKNLDWPGATEMSERIKKTMNPSILDDGKGNVSPEQLKAQVGQQNQMIQQLSQALTAAQEEIKTKKLELSSKERIKQAELQVDIEKELFKGGNANAQFQLEQTLKSLQMQQAALELAQPLTQNQNQAPGNSAAAPGMNQPTGGTSPG